MDKKECLQILDELDTLRRKTEYRPKDSADFVLRVAAAIVAEHGGFTGRAEWCAELRKDPSTEFAKYYYFFPNVDLHNGKAIDGNFIPKEEPKP